MKIQLIIKENILILTLMIVLMMLHQNLEIIIQGIKEMTMIQIIIPNANLQSIIHLKGRSIKEIEVEVNHHHTANIKSLIKRNLIMTEMLIFILLSTVKT